MRGKRNRKFWPGENNEWSSHWSIRDSLIKYEDYADCHQADQSTKRVESTQTESQQVKAREQVCMCSWPVACSRAIELNIISANKKASYQQSHCGPTEIY